jgi:outer membrane protein insertion porin family
MSNWIKSVRCLFFALTLLKLTVSSDAIAVDRSNMIDSIQINGVPSEWIESLRAVSGVLPGEDYIPERAERGANRLKEFFENKGYVNSQLTYAFRTLPAEIATSSKKTGLIYDVNLGKPIPILSIDYLFLGGTVTDLQLGRIRSAVDFIETEAFDRDRIKEMRRSIESVLALLSFIDSRVIKVENDLKEAGVKVQFEIELGQRVAFSVQGNEFFTRSELMAMIEAQRAVGLGRDYVNVLQTLMKSRYVEQGFRSVLITPYSFEARQDDPRKILFSIQEGPRSKIKSLKFDGNEVFSATQLEDLFYKNAHDRIVSRVYNEQMVDQAAKSMIEEVRRFGYLSAKMIALRTEELNKKGEVLIHIFISEGLQTRVDQVQFQGNQVLSSEQLGRWFGFKSGDPMNLLKLEEGLERIKREYRNLGYLDVKVISENESTLVSYSEKNQKVDLSLLLEEGLQSRLSAVRVFGNEKTNREVILREIQIQTGEPLSEQLLTESEERLRRLGIFSQVVTELVDDPTATAGWKVLKVTVQEATPGNVGFGAGYRNDLGLRLFSEITYANLWGKNHSWVFNLSGNRRLELYRFLEYSAQFSYIWPWLMLGETTFRPSLSIERRQFIQFSAQTSSLTASLDRPLWKRIGLSGGIVYSLENIRQFDAVNKDDNQQLRIGALTPNFRIDLRDNPLVPRKGFYAINSFEYAHPSLGAQGDPIPVSYGRYQLRMDGYIEATSKLVWYTSFRGGLLKNFANVIDDNGQINPKIKIPLIKQFALGGVNSLRGFNLQEINVQTNDVQGSLSFVNYRTQFDYFVSQNLSFGPFLDAGNLTLDRVVFGALRYGAGIGMRYATPVGPVNFDWGFKLSPRPGEDTSVFYFSLGVI